MTTKTVTDTLRSNLASIEGRQTELLAERDELSYLALVDRQPAAIKRLAAINEEIENLKTQAGSIEPALREAVRRETQAAEEARAEKRRDDARQADAILDDAEKLALAFDDSLRTVRETAVAFEAAMIKVRRLTGASPQHDAVRVFMFRAVRTAFHQSPIHVDAIAPSERTELALFQGLGENSPVWIANTVNNKAREAA
jgi:hypothetical protein